jgi:hypothetical protein
MKVVPMGLGQFLMPVRAWWFLLIAKSAAIPPDVGHYLMALRDRNLLALEEIERKRQAIIDKGAADGRTISTEAALKYVLERKATYDEPDREEYVAELDRFIDDVRKEYGPQIPVDQAYAMLNELQARFGRSLEAASRIGTPSTIGCGKTDDEKAMADDPPQNASTK